MSIATAGVSVGAIGRQLVTRTHHRFEHDPGRVIVKPYLPGEEIGTGTGTASRAELLMARILAIPEQQAREVLERTLACFASRHVDFEGTLEHHFDLVAHLAGEAPLSRERRLLIGTYFTNEYSIEGAALFNPSIVLGPDQSGLAAHERRFVMSLRAVGEGHISSIEFRSGVVDGASHMKFDPIAPLAVTGMRTSPPSYDKRQFRAKLVELAAGNELAWAVLDPLPQRFTLAELERSLVSLEVNGPPVAISFETVRIIRMLASSNYVTSFARQSKISERVIFPAGPHETRGMEDARFVRFVDDDGSVSYYATYTAYDGFEIMPQLIHTDDFLSFRIGTLNGPAAQNKGMALFPRRIDGRYVMLSRRDRENLHIATSTEVGHWAEVTPLSQPSRWWELLQIGNCGSPVETKAGWLVITHGVGPMRRYVLGAMLLDLADPSKVLGQLEEPLLEPEESEREGYVPNVVYSCGGMVNGEHLILPYGLSDGAISIALIDLAELLDRIARSGRR